ncbi:hypothetical protein [Mucilaginibacter sp.]|uniref:hypothetical protein n=1 Tax=Mucilaginibacter sp. TaxID=1882438 RepID=UPI00261604A0|nr:hypothetical protein [Mucilaginibacter sp.]
MAKKDTAPRMFFSMVQGFVIQGALKSRLLAFVLDLPPVDLIEVFLGYEFGGFHG